MVGKEDETISYWVSVGADLRVSPVIVVIGREVFPCNPVRVGYPPSVPQNLSFALKILVMFCLICLSPWDEFSQHDLNQAPPFGRKILLRGVTFWKSSHGLAYRPMGNSPHPWISFFGDLLRRFHLQPSVSGRCGMFSRRLMLVWWYFTGWFYHGI